MNLKVFQGEVNHRNEVAGRLQVRAGVSEGEGGERGRGCGLLWWVQDWVQVGFITSLCRWTELRLFLRHYLKLQLHLALRGGEGGVGGKGHKRR